MTFKFFIFLVNDLSTYVPWYDWFPRTFVRGVRKTEDVNKETDIK